MAKILYIPTGQYLKFYNGSNVNYPTEVEWEKLDAVLTVEKKLEHLTSEKFSCSDNWLEINKVILPILKSEIEIIYD